MKENIKLVLALILLCVLTILALISGRALISPREFIEAIQGCCTPAATILWDIRAPRIAIGIAAGAGLSCAGAAYQNIFQNPLVSPDILGASAGAGLGAATAILFGAPFYIVTLAAFLTGAAAVFAVALIAGVVKYNHTLGLVLSGMIISSLCAAGVSLIKLTADPANTLPAITYWLMGSLASVRNEDLIIAITPIAIGIIAIYLLRWRLNLLALGDEEASALGVNTKKIRLTTIVAATLITASTVAFCGVIGWIGLITPHISRIIIGCDCRKMIPMSIFIGAIFMLLADTLARTLAPSEIPIGILTAFAGAPFFLYLIIREGELL